MSRSPIEMMIDKVCGFDPDAPEYLPKPDTKEAAEILLELADAAVQWRLSEKDSNIARLQRAVDNWLDIGGE